MMNKRILTLFFVVLTVLNGFGAEVEEALQTVPAPAGEFVRMPAGYIFQRLEKQAQRSGLPVLGGLSIESRVDGLDSGKITVSFENMNMIQALNAVAAATGTVLVYEGTAVVFADASTVQVVETEVIEEPEEGYIAGEEVQFSDVNAALVFVETGVGRGSAFIAEQDGKTYLFSNQHNFMGASNLKLLSMNGNQVVVESFEFSSSRDLVRFALDPEKNPGLGVLQLSDEVPYIGQAIVVYGNSAGGNVATELRGKVLGVGPHDIEVDADIVSGNSGSPVLDSAGRVLGVATYIALQPAFDKKDNRQQIYKGTRFGKTRRYGVRIPNDDWVEIQFRGFLNQSYRLADMNSVLEIMHCLIAYWNGDEEYADVAEQILSSYSSRSDRVTAPYEFHFSETEEEIRMMVKAFKRNYEEFVNLIRRSDLTKKEMARMFSAKSLMSTSELERLDYHIRTTMLSRAKRVHEDLARYRWMSDYLKERAQPLDEMAGELVRTLESEKGLEQRVRAVM